MRVALIQQRYHLTKEKTILRSVNLIREAGANGAKLVILQELHKNEYFWPVRKNTKIFWRYAFLLLKEGLPIILGLKCWAKEN